MTDADDRSRFSRAEWAIVVVTLLFVAVQAALPAFITRRGDRQVEFAWELYSKGAPDEVFVVRMSDVELTLRPSDVVEFNRAVIDYPARLPPLLCERHDAVQVDVVSGESREEHPCE